MHDDTLDVAVIGAGVSGVYAAWRLLTEGDAKRVTVFEADDHVGGRLLSVDVPHIPDMRAELGGMRILPAVQPRIAKLLEKLNGDASPASKIETYSFPVDQPDNIAYLRGTHLRLEDFTASPELVPYNLTFQEIGKTVGAIAVGGIEQILPGITDMTDAERRERVRTATFNGKPLREQGFWQVLLRVLSGEAYQLVLTAGGYQTVLSNWNAADAIPWFLSDFGVAPEYKGFKKGFQQVPLEVAERLRAAGGKVELNTRLAGFESGDDGVVLHFDCGRTVRAKSLILAMPRRALEILAPTSPLLRDPAVAALVESVTPRPLFKLFTTYDHPWWTAAGVQAGRTTTDLPVRQTYYWPKDTGKPALKGRAMLMASYDDSLNIGFWDGFRPRRSGGPGSAGPMLKLFMPGERDAACDDWYRYKAPAGMVEEIQRQLLEIHGMHHIPDVVDASFRDWGDDPFGGGWNSWNIGVDSATVRDTIVTPRPGTPVHICGEAYSDAQGWVEGALQTADILLRDAFDLPSPV